MDSIIITIFVYNFKLNKMKVKGFGVVVQVGEHYVVLQNDFERFKTFGNWNLNTDPIVVLDSEMKQVEYDEELWERLEMEIERQVVDEDYDEE